MIWIVHNLVPFFLSAKQKLSLWRIQSIRNIWNDVITNSHSGQECSHLTSGLQVHSPDCIQARQALSGRVSHYNSTDICLGLGGGTLWKYFPWIEKIFDNSLDLKYNFDMVKTEPYHMWESWWNHSKNCI